MKTKAKGLLARKMEDPAYRKRHEESYELFKLEVQLLNALERKHWTYSDLAKVMGTQKSAISRDLKGRGLRMASMDRIEALFFLYFLALMVQGLIERELRGAMKRGKIQELPLYPEERQCKHPTTEQILRLFSLAEGHVLLRRGQVVQIFSPELTPLQQQVRRLLGVPADAYQVQK